MTQHVVKLLRGDKRNPTRTLDLASGLSTGSIFLRSGGFSPGPGSQATIWSGQTGRRHGQRRISSSRDNMQVSLTVDLKGTTTAELGWLAREIQRFFLECRLYEEGAEGEKIWLEYRWQDGLDDLPAPVFGQFSHYLRILDGQIPAWPGELHNGALTAGQIEGVVAELTCAPFAEGLPQRAADLCDGFLTLTNNGVVVGHNHTNYCTNPSFGNSTWDTDWSVSDADLNIINETRADFTRSLDSSAHLVNISASDQTFTQSLTLGTGPWNVSCFVRKADGTAPTSSDLQIVSNSSAQTTTFVQIDDTAWYLAYAQASSGAGAVTYGVEVKAGREVWIDDVQIELRVPSDSPSPFVSGHLLGCSWSSTAHASNSTGAAPTMRWTLSDQLAGEFTAAGWWSPLWGDDDARVDYAVAEYYVDANNYWCVYFDYTADRFEVTGKRDSVAIAATGAAQSFSYGAHFHIAVRQDTTTLKVYVNGSEDISATTAVGMLESGIFQLGNSALAAVYPSSAAIDGWHIWRQALTATQVDALYDSEKPIKDGYGLVGLPPFLWTEDGDSILDNVDDSSRNNWAVVGGIAGDVEADTEWRIDPPASPVSVFWLGRKAIDEPIDAGIFWLELQGSADGNSSGGEYEEIAAGTSDDWYGDGDTLTTYLKYLPGRYQYLSRFYVATNELVVRPAWDLNSSAATADVHMGDEVTVGTDANFLFRDFGDMIVRFPDGIATPTLARFMLRIDRTSTATVRGDFVMMLPYPAVRCEAINTAALSFAASEVLVITDDEAYSRTSAGYVHYLFERRGDPVTLVPNKYNYVWLLQGEEGAQYDVTDTATVRVYVTPRWLLPGGAVA